MKPSFIISGSVELKIGGGQGRGGKILWDCCDKPQVNFPSCIGKIN